MIRFFLLFTGIGFVVFGSTLDSAWVIGTELAITAVVAAALCGTLTFPTAVPFRRRVVARDVHINWLPRSGRCC
jgi:hypothetical protein